MSEQCVVCMHVEDYWIIRILDIYIPHFPEIILYFRMQIQFINCWIHSFIYSVMKTGIETSCFLFGGEA
jgi:hypothetical protein